MLKWPFVLLAALIGGYLLIRWNSGAGKPEDAAAAGESDAESNEFHAVTVLLDANPCAAAKRVASQRYLSNEAPGFPLPECDRPACNCRYEHHADQCEPEDRRKGLYSGYPAGPADEKRNSTDRRVGDPGSAT